MNDGNTPLTDNDLTAYLDGEADTDVVARVEMNVSRDPDLAQRLSDLEHGKEALTSALDLEALNAPQLPNHLLGSAEASSETGVLHDISTSRSSAKRFTGRPSFVWPSAIAASFAAGLVVMAALLPLLDREQPSDWVEAVASYQALYVTATVDGANQPAADTAAVLAEAEQVFGLDLQPATQIDGLTFKRAQILGFEGELLLQMAYIDDAGVPFAFCMTRISEGDAAQSNIMSHDLAATQWVRDGVGFVLIGGQNQARVSTLAADLYQSL